MSTLYYVPQYFSTFLNVGGGIDNSQTTGIILQSVSGLDITKPGILCITWANPLDTSVCEWIAYTSINGSNELVGVTRAFDGYGAKAHLNGAVVAFPLSKSHINNINDGLLNFSGGWREAGETWNYASASVMTTPAGAQSRYAVGDRIKWTQDATTKYGVIREVQDTGFLIAINTNYTIANSTITNPYYSHEVSPIGYPQWFAYTPTGISASNVTQSGRFNVIGRICTVNYLATFSGGITFTTNPTLPIVASASILGEVNLVGCGNVGYLDAGTNYVNNVLYPSVYAAAATLAMDVNTSGAGISATVPITWANGDKLGANFRYEI